jgi:Zn finger protein HypA/HybF involved in hydrogenase expression
MREFKIVERYECHCKRCGHKWLSIYEHPIACAKCTSSYWDREPVYRKRNTIKVVENNE